MKRFFLFLTALLIANLASAQLKIVPQIGVNGTRYSNDAGSNINFKEARMGFHFGGNLRVGGKVFLEPGIYWYKTSSEMEKVDPSGINPSLIDKAEVNSVKVPVALGFSVVNSDLFRLRLSAGPAVSWVTSVRNNSIFTKDDFNSNVWSARFGLGLDLWFVTVDVNYDMGISRAFAEESNKTKSHILSLTAGLRL